MELEVLVTLEFRVTVTAKSNEIFESLVRVLEDYEETEVYDIDALLDLSTSTISLTAASKSLSFRDAESGARQVLEELFALSLPNSSHGALVSVSAEARPEKLLSSL